MKRGPHNRYLIGKNQITRLNPPALCRYAGCGQPVHALGRCHQHYMQRYRRLKERETA